MKSKDSVRYTRKALPKNSYSDKLKNMPKTEIKNSAKAERDNPRWTKKMLESTLLKMPQKKVLIHMYLDEDIVKWFKLEGRGYQTRINSVLKSYVHKQTQKRS